MHKILIVEDEAILLDAYKILFSMQNDYETHFATNGQEALELCTSMRFDLILLDLMMPVLDGVGFLEKANLNQTYPSTKVLIMSNLSSGELLAEAMNKGAHDHFVKSSLNPTDLLSIVSDNLDSSKA